MDRLKKSLRQQVREMAHHSEFPNLETSKNLPNADFSGF